jgi:micrococcal nuclease
VPARVTPRVIGIADGGRITVLSGRSRTHIRLHWIDVHETGQDYGSLAKQGASELAFGKAVTVRPVDTDRDGRTVSVVILSDWRSMNRELRDRGAASWNREFFPADNRLARLVAGRVRRQDHAGPWGTCRPW